MAGAALGWRPYALLALLCLLLYLPGLSSLPPVDRDEARFAQATRQMLETGDLLDIRFQNEARNKKPACIYWLQALSVGSLSNAASPAIWPYRLPSLIAGVVAVLLTFLFGARLIGREAALLGAALLAGTITLVYEAHLATTDATLLATCVASQGAVGEIYRRARVGERAGWGWAFLFWVAQGFGVLVKGPVTPLLGAVTIIALAIADRRWRWLGGLRAWWGVPLLLVMTVPWLIAISVVTHGAFLRDSVGHDFAGKIAGAQESHGAFPGTYLLLLPATFWPGSLFLGAATMAAWRRWREPAVRFLIAWVVPFWLVLELVPTKLPHYPMPVYPALALLIGHAVSHPVGARWRWLDAIVGIAWLGVALGLAALLVIAPMKYGSGASIPALASSLILFVLGGWIILGASTLSTPATLLAGVLLSILVVAPTLGVVIPSLDRVWLTRGAAAMVARASPPDGVPIVSVGYNEPSLVFALGTMTRLASPGQAAQAMATVPVTLALVESREEPAFRAALAKQGLVPRAIDAVAGIDYSNGHDMTLTLFASEPP